MRELVVEWLLHATVAAAVIEWLIARWRPARADERLALRSLALILPVVAPPVLHQVAAFRLDPAFADTWALLASRHWAGVRLWGVGVGTLLLILAFATGVWVYARDLVPLVRDARRRDDPHTPVAAGTPLAVLVGELAGKLGIATPPPVQLVDDEAPVLFVTGGGRPMLVVSRGAIARLDSEALRAVVAHELAHVSRGDLVLGWILMGLRTAMIFNPIIQLVARGVALEMERRADEAAALVVGDPVVVASGIERLLEDQVNPPGDGPPAWSDRTVGGALAARARSVALRRRTSRLRAGWPPAPLTYARVRVALAGATVATLLFFVV